MSITSQTKNIIQQGWLAALLGLAALGLAAYFFLAPKTDRVFTLKISAGDRLGRRHRLAQVLALRAEKYKLAITIEPTKGSEESLQRVSEGTLDAALIQGGLEPLANVRQVTALTLEPLHLLVKPELAGKTISDLKGKRLNLSTKGSGTRRLALRVLTFAGLRAEKDYHTDSLSYQQIETLPPDMLPDGVFTVSMLPSPVASVLIQTHGYRLMEIPFGESLALRDIWIHDASVPAYAYSVSPAIPEREVHTIGTELLFVCNAALPPEAVRRLIEILFESDFGAEANLAMNDIKNMDRLPEFALHEGVVMYLNRNNPLLTPDAIGGLESLRSFFVSIAVGIFLLWRWYRKRELIGFEKYLRDVSQIESEILELEKTETITVEKLLDLRERLSKLKLEVLEKNASGALDGDELFTGFITYATDVNQQLGRLIVSERERENRERLREHL